MVPERTESRGRADRSELSAERNAFGFVPSEDGMERAGYRKTIYRLTNPFPMQRIDARLLTEYTDSELDLLD